MKKRIFVLFLALVFLVGCQPRRKEVLKSPMRFYYPVTDEAEGLENGILNYETREIYGHEGDYHWILREYLKGPNSEQLIAPFRKDTELISAQLEEQQLHVLLSEHFGKLSGVDLTLACACLTMTCLELPEIETVQIRAQGQLLNSQAEIQMSREDLLLEDHGSDLISNTYTLYFSDTNNRYLIGVPIQVEKHQDDLPTYLVEQLLQGPEETGLADTIPLGTRLLGVEVAEGVCSVDLSEEFRERAPKSHQAQRLTLLSLANTLTQLEEIHSVVLCIEGNLMTEYGIMDLRRPLTFEEGAVGPARTALSELDADLYLPAGEDSILLTRVPTRVQQSANRLPSELVVEALLHYEDQNGYHSPIPEGTELLSLRLQGERCIIDLSSEFLSVGSQKQLTQAVRSVGATAISQCSCSLVQITVEGETPQGDYDGLFDLLAWTENWMTN